MKVICQQCSFTEGNIGDTCKWCSATYDGNAKILNKNIPASSERELQNLTWSINDCSWWRWSHRICGPSELHLATGKNGIIFKPGDKIDLPSNNCFPGTVLDPPLICEGNKYSIVFRTCRGLVDAIMVGEDLIKIP